LTYNPAYNHAYQPIQIIIRVCVSLSVFHQYQEDPPRGRERTRENEREREREKGRDQEKETGARLLIHEWKQALTRGENMAAKKTAALRPGIVVRRSVIDDR
jgi:hypothetical protein